MYTVNYNLSNAEEILQHFLQMDLKTIQQEVEKLPIEKIAAVVNGINENNDKKWQEKIRALFSGLSQRDSLQELGKALNCKQALEILNLALEQEAVHHWKLLPIMVGMPHSVFEEVLLSATPQHLQVIKLEGITEPIQHQLTILLHEWAKEVESKSLLIHNLLKEITNLEPKKMTRQSFDVIQNTLADVSDYFQHVSIKISKALSIAWNTNRSDLIDKMTTLKDSCMKYNAVVIGHPNVSEKLSTGLYKLLNKRLDTVYGNLDDPEMQTDALADDDPAIEGLTKLEVWYLHDYWEIGLLPGVKEPQVIEQEDHSIGDKKHSKERESLYFLALDNLQRLGLVNVSDFKNAAIFSKAMLQDFISENRAKLRSQ